MRLLFEENQAASFRVCKFFGRPAGLHDAFCRVGVRTEEEMSNLVCRHVAQETCDVRAFALVQPLHGFVKQVGVAAASVACLKRDAHRLSF